MDPRAHDAPRGALVLSDDDDCFDDFDASFEFGANVDDDETETTTQEIETMTTTTETTAPATMTPAACEKLFRFFCAAYDSQVRDIEDGTAGDDTIPELRARALESFVEFPRDKFVAVFKWSRNFDFDSVPSGRAVYGLLWDALDAAGILDDVA